MNQPNSSMQAPNGQIPNTQQQQQQQTPQQQQQQQQQQVNLGHPNDVPNVNWRAEVSDVDRNRFVSQLSLALKHLSPATSDNETYNVASNFEAGLYQRCTSKNQYILAYAKKFQHIREQINQNNGNLNNFQPQPMSPLAGVNNAQSPQLQRNNFQSPLNLNQQQQQVMPTQNAQMRPQSNFNMVQQGRPPQNQLQQQQQGTPVQSPAQTQAQAQAQMLAQQRSAAAAAMAMSNNPQLMQRPQQQQQQQQSPISLNLLQNMNTANAAQAGLNISPQQFQMYFARQMALQQQQQQQQQQGQPQNAQQQLQNQLLQQQIQQQNYNTNNLGMAPQQMLNMGMAAGNKAMMGGNNSMPSSNPMGNNPNFRPQQQQQQQQTTQENAQNTNNPSLSVDSPLQQNSTVNFNPGSMSASSTPITVPVTLASVQQQQKMQQQQQQQQPFNSNMMRPPQPNSQQAQQMVNQELLMQRLQQQQQQQQQQQSLMDGAMGGQRPPLQQTPQQFVQQGMYSQPGMQRPMLNAQQQLQMQQQQPQNMNFKPLTSIQRNNAAAIVKQMDESVRQGRVRAPVIDDLSENDKIAIREQMGLMRTMYDKIDNLLPIFLAMTNNSEATRRLILMKYMFEDQLVALGHNKFLISLENLNKLREQFNGYFTWVRNAVGQHHQQQMMANMNNGMQNPLMNQQQIGLGLMPMHMSPQQQQQQPQAQSMSPQTMQGSPVVNYNMMSQHNLMAQQGMMAPQGMIPAQSQAQAFAMLQRQAAQQAQQQQQQNTPQQAHVQLPQNQQGQSPSLQNQQAQSQQQENLSEATTSAAATAPVPSASVENTPVMGNAQANPTAAPTTPTAGMKRGSIDLRLPMTKKQRGSKSSASSQSPTLSRKNQKANADKEKPVGTPASAPASSTLSQQPPPQNQELTSLSASNSPAMINNNATTGLTHPSMANNMNNQAMSSQMAASMDNNQMNNGNPNFNMQYNGGIPVRAGMPLNQHQAQSQAFYMAAVNNGIPPQIVSLLPPKALQFNWFLQQAAQKKMNLSPQQQQQLQGMLNDHIEAAKQQLMQQSSASTSAPMVHQQNQLGRSGPGASITTPASILMNQQPLVNNNGFDMPQHQQQQLSLQQQQQQLYQQHMQQQALQHHQMQQQLQHQLNQKNQMQQQSMQSQQSPAQVMQSQQESAQDSKDSKVTVKKEEDAVKIKQEKQNEDNKDNIPKSPKADNQDLSAQNPKGDEDVMSSIYFSNVVLKDMSSMMDDMGQEKNPMSLQNNAASSMATNSPQMHMTPQQYHQQAQQNQPPSHQPQNTSSNGFDSYSSALKEGYKDETFGTPDLSLLTKPSAAVKEEDNLAETNDLQSSWYDSAGGMDIGMDVFDWDNNDFVEFGDNDGALVTPTASGSNTNANDSSNTKNNEDNGDSKSSKDDKKLLDEGNKAVAVSL